MHNSSGLTPVSSWLNWIMDMVVLTSAFPHFTFSSVDSNLGVTLDKELTLDSHIYSLCRTCYKGSVSQESFRGRNSLLYVTIQQFVYGIVMTVHKKKTAK